jgi:hypothetical protein
MTTAVYDQTIGAGDQLQALVAQTRPGRHARFVVGSSSSWTWSGKQRRQQLRKLELPRHSDIPLQLHLYTILKNLRLQKYIVNGTKNP